MAAHQTVDEPVPTGNTYNKYVVSNPIERRLMDGFFRSLDASLPVEAPGRVLEVGMGEAEIASRVRDRYRTCTIVGIDLPDPELAAAWDAQEIPGTFADIAHLPFPSASFDLVLAIEVLEHVPQPEAALRELARVGCDRFVLSVPREPIWRVANLARGKYVGALGNTPGHIQHWSRRSFRQFVGSHLDIIDARSPLPWSMISAQARTVPRR